MIESVQNWLTKWHAPRPIRLQSDAFLLIAREALNVKQSEVVHTGEEQKQRWAADSHCSSCRSALKVELLCIWTGTCVCLCRCRTVPRTFYRPARSSQQCRLCPSQAPLRSCWWVWRSRHRIIGVTLATPFHPTSPAIAPGCREEGFASQSRLMTWSELADETRILN